MENGNTFKDKVVLIVGRPTEVYLQIIRAFLEAGAYVVAPTRSLLDIQAIKTYKDNHQYPKLITEITDAPDHDKAVLLTEIILQRFGQLHLAISMFGLTHSYASAGQLCCDDWFNVVDEDLSPFFVSAMVVMEAMKKQGAGMLVHITDSSQFDEAFTPLTMLSLKTKLSLSKIFAAEAEQDGVNYYHLWVQNLRSKRPFPLRSNSPHISPEMVSEHIKRLYEARVYDKGKVFQLFPDKILAS